MKIQYDIIIYSHRGFEMIDRNTIKNRYSGIKCKNVIYVHYMMSICSDTVQRSYI